MICTLILFCNYISSQELSEIHAGFLSDLTRVIAASPNSNGSSFSGYACNTSASKTLGDVFLHWKSRFVIYGDYCANLTKAQDLIDELCAKNDNLCAEVAVSSDL